MSNKLLGTAQQTNRVLAVGLLGMICCITSCGGNSDNGSSSKTTANVNADLAACSAIGWKVANGDSCSVGEDPYSSSIVRLSIFGEDESMGVCTGTVLDQHTVLTAAHCFMTQATAVGIDTAVDSVYASGVSVHPEFTAISNELGPIMFNDVALVFTNEELQAKPASLLLSRAAETGEEAIVSGFGVTEPDDSPGFLHAGKASVRDITPNHIFVSFQDDESHPCGGDSGGPLLLWQGEELMIAGVVSQSDPSVVDKICQPGDLTLYTNTQNASVLNFINSYVSQPTSIPGM